MFYLQAEKYMLIYFSYKIFVRAYKIFFTFLFSIKLKQKIKFSLIIIFFFNYNRKTERT